MNQNQLKHVGFILDGNGRWAKQRNKPRTFGHSEGVKRLIEIIKGCLEFKIKCASFFCFSTENWGRPSTEVNFLLKLVSDNLNKKDVSDWFKDHQVRFIWNGQKTNLSEGLIKRLNSLMQETQNYSKLTVQIMFNYGGRQEIVDACNRLVKQNKPIDLTNLDKEINQYHLDDLDLLIRTSGEQRVSNFMLWQLFYAELIFTPLYWPEYNLDAFKQDIEIFKNRKRRFGKGV